MNLLDRARAAGLFQWRSWPASPLAIFTIRSFGITATLYGFALILQDDRRWGGPTYAAAVALAPQDVWGIVIAVFGGCIIVGSIVETMWVRNIGLFGLAVWLFTLSSQILTAAVVFPEVPYAGAILLCGFAVNALIVSAAREGE